MFAKQPLQARPQNVKQSAKSVSAPAQLKRKRKADSAAPNMHLERIIGLTAFRPSALAIHPQPDTPIIAYPAGGVTTIFNHKRNRQVNFLVPSTGAAAENAGKRGAQAAGIKSVVSLAFSPDGEYLAVGEAGHQPRILIWDFKKSTIVSELLGHKFGVLAIAFSPNGRYLVSVGYQHDGQVFVWNWKSGTKLACNKISTKASVAWAFGKWRATGKRNGSGQDARSEQGTFRPLTALSFDPSGNFFVTVGLRHIKFWAFDTNTSLLKKPSLQQLTKGQVQLIEGRYGVMGDHKNSCFADVTCLETANGDVHTYAITEKGLLVLFSAERVMEKWVDLKVTAGLSICANEAYIACGCTDGVIRLFEPTTLKYITTLPKPHPLGIDVALNVYQHPAEGGAMYPDVVAVRWDPEGEKLTAVYSDRSLYMWDVRDLKHVGKYRSFLGHGDCVWGVETCPTLQPSSDTTSPPTTMPPNTFATHSSDGTIRFWNVDTPGEGEEQQQRYIGRNLWSKDLLKVVYVDKGGVEKCNRRDGFDTTDSEAANGEKTGVRALKVSGDGRWMCSGDRAGNVRIHDLRDFSQVTYMEAHEAELLAIDFTAMGDTQSPTYLATASRDRLIHIFDVRRGFQLVQTIDDHSASIMAVKFSDEGRRLVSCAADKSVIFRGVHELQDDTTTFTPYHTALGRSTAYDMDVDPSSKYVTTVTQDRRINIYSVSTGKLVRTHRPDPLDDATFELSGGGFVKCAMDPTGSFVVTSGSDRVVRVFDFLSGG
ncbi:hypothetical protein HDV00_012293, partial [Rhizophlyctis rosea]